MELRQYDGQQPTQQPTGAVKGHSPNLISFEEGDSAFKARYLTETMGVSAIDATDIVGKHGNNSKLLFAEALKRVHREGDQS